MMIIKILISLLVSLGVAYFMLERQRQTTAQLQNLATAAPAATQATSGAQTGQAPMMVQGQDGRMIDLSSLPPEARQVIQAQLKAANDAAIAHGGSEMAVADPPSAPPVRSDVGPKQFTYRDRNDAQTVSFASGWTVLLERKLSDRYTTLADQAMAHLENQLDRAAAALPRPAMAELRKIQVFLSLDAGRGAPIRYVWPESGSEGRLEITHAQGFIDAAQGRPWLVMHELAHAYHHRVLGGSSPAVLKAYQDAQKIGAYNQVRWANGKTGRSNALSSEREFFAELTRSFYGRSDYYPFVREEFQQHDLASSRMIEAAWNSR